MRPREQVIALWSDKPIAENLRIAQMAGHSRFPVCEGSLDNVKGMLLIREWLWQLQILGPQSPFQPLLRPAITFDLKTPVHAMIEKFRTALSHLAIVIAEHKQVAGIVTVEDVKVPDTEPQTDNGLALRNCRRTAVFERGKGVCLKRFLVFFCFGDSWEHPPG